LVVAGDGNSLTGFSVVIARCTTVCMSALWLSDPTFYLGLKPRCGRSMCDRTARVS
jgi:hypothetical protein